MEKIEIKIVNFIQGVILTVAAILFIIAALPIIFGLIFNLGNNSFKKKAETTTAKIISIDIIDDWTTPIVEFYVGEEKYVGELNHYDSSMHVGQEVTIYYDPLNPNEFRGVGMELSSLFWFSAIPLIMGIIMIGVNLGIGKVVKKSIMLIEKRKKIIEYNYILEADIISINLVPQAENMELYVMEAIYNNPADGNIYHFKSDYFRYDAASIIEHYNIKTIPVYVNPSDYTEYVVDLSIMKEYIANFK